MVLVVTQNEITENLIKVTVIISHVGNTHNEKFFRKFYYYFGWEKMGPVKTYSRNWKIVK